MLDNFQRIAVETIRRHRGNISITLMKGEDKQSVSTVYADAILNHDLALAMQAYFNRQNQLRNKSKSQVRNL